jgi:PEP-CTERM motif
MKSMFMLTAAIAANLAIAATAAPASANLVLETATYTGVDTGETVPQDGRFVGAAFTLGGTEQITSVGAQFGGFPSGTIFAAIVPLASQTSLPSFLDTDIAANAIADVVFSVPMQPNGGPIDMSVPLSVTLTAGSYAVVFGSGAFGADGWAGLGEDNNVVGSPNWISTLFDNTWSADSYDGIRITVTAAGAGAVPEPSTWAMLILGFAGLGAAERLRARRRKLGLQAA